MSTWLVAVLGVGFGLGVILVAAGIYGRDSSRIPAFRVRRLRRAGSSLRERRDLAGRWGSAAVAGSAAWVFTGWPVMGIGIAVFVVFVPWLFGAGAIAKARIARLEAIEDWVRRLTDVMVAGNLGLASALHRSTATASPVIADEVAALVVRLRRWEFDEAMLAFANDIDDQVGDDAAAGLIVANQQGAGVTDVLKSLAVKISEEVAARRNAEVERARPRATARLMIIMFVGAILLFSVVATTYLAAYDTVVGQIVLVTLLAMLGGTLVWLRQLGLGAMPPRYLIAPPAKGGRSR